MNHPRTLRRRVGATAALTVAAASLAVVSAPPASADTPENVLKWGMSQYLNEHLTSQTFTDGASEGADGVVTFTAGVGRRDTSTGVTSVEYQGSAHYGFAMGGPELYWVTFTDPQVRIDADGDGEILADVSWMAPGPVTGTAEDVEVTSFDATPASWSGATLSATPHWTGVVVPGTAPYPADRPVDGATWSPAMVTALPSSVRATFYASGSANDPKKRPAAFAATVAPTVAVTSTVSAAGVSVDVAGSGFTAVTNPGDAGVYAGIAKSGGLPDVASMSNQSSFVASAYALPSQIVDGKFTKTLVAPAAKLVAGTSYSVYTWQAHSHSNTTQDTETPLTINWNAIATTVKPVVTGASATYGSPSTVVVSVPGAGGTVKVEVLGTSRTATLSNGNASFEVPANVPAGSYPVSISYSGEFTHFPSSTTATLTVSKAGTKTVVAVKPKPTAKKAGKAKVTGPAGAKVAVVVKQGKKTVKKATVTLGATGAGTVTLPKAPKGGRFTVTATYAGDANREASSDKATYTVKPPKKSKKR